MHNAPEVYACVFAFKNRHGHEGHVQHVKGVTDVENCRPKVSFLVKFNTSEYLSTHHCAEINCRYHADITTHQTVSIR